MDDHANGSFFDLENPRCGARPAEDDYHPRPLATHWYCHDCGWGPMLWSPPSSACLVCETDLTTEMEGGQGHEGVLGKGQLGSWEEEDLEKNKKGSGADPTRLRTSADCSPLVRNACAFFTFGRVFSVLFTEGLGEDWSSRRDTTATKLDEEPPARDSYVHYGPNTGWVTIPRSTLQHVQPWPKTPRKRSTAASIVALAVAFGSAFIMTAYNSSSGTENYGAMGASVNLSALHPVLTKLDPGAHLPAFVTDPTPAVFLIACCTYAAASLVYHKLHSDDKHQANFFVGGSPYHSHSAYFSAQTCDSLLWRYYRGPLSPLEKEFDEERLMRLGAAEWGIESRHLTGIPYQELVNSEEEIGIDGLDKKEHLIENDSHSLYKNDNKQGEQHNEKVEKDSHHRHDDKQAEQYNEKDPSLMDKL
ncbi:hypothetical protein H2199_005092 [Coniosporium tulheliwenetii]|uniref:Uncharacterized protein n=1 Tax=Coniosporium tulheliwenetii TaxID=3383036 RepID=A0ACC2Z2X6_9PEZI|nr:hypothetical protein H2199_005092 [Cladosporium sp. JES 115]